jgi:hypothetical protein
MRHRHREPAPATRRFVTDAPLESTPKGKVVIEITAYPAGHVALALSKVSGSARSRTIRQHGEGLMFNDANEAKDAIDAIVDRLSAEAGSRRPQ